MGTIPEHIFYVNLFSFQYWTLADEYVLLFIFMVETKRFWEQQG